MSITMKCIDCNAPVDIDPPGYWCRACLDKRNDNDPVLQSLKKELKK